MPIPLNNKVEAISRHVDRMAAFCFWSALPLFEIAFVLACFDQVA
jgi:hypothetical protein